MATTDAPPLLSVRDVHLHYGATLALGGVSLEVPEGEIFAVIGPSGCGKTSLLRVIGGLERAESGEVWLDGARLDGTPAHRRGIGLMFQELALFPHLDVESNVAFGLRMQGRSGSARAARVAEMLALVGLSGYGGRKVHELSGGERQRVALARSLAPRPRLLMLDEPVGALDRALREELLSELAVILRSQGLTGIYVTHDQEEAFALADRVLVMEGGLARQSGRPEEIYGDPVDAWVARFLGRTNLVAGELTPGEAGTSRVRTPVGEFVIPHAGATPGPVTLLLGDERARVEPADAAEESDGEPMLVGEIMGRSFQGRRVRLHVRSGGSELTFGVDPPSGSGGWRVGDVVRVRLDPASIRVLPSEG